MESKIRSGEVELSPDTGREFDTDSLLIGDVIKPKQVVKTTNDIKLFKKEIKPELLGVMNAITRSAVEQYAKDRKFPE